MGRSARLTRWRKTGRPGSRLRPMTPKRAKPGSAAEAWPGTGRCHRVEAPHPPPPTCALRHRRLSRSPVTGAEQRFRGPSTRTCPSPPGGACSARRSWPRAAGMAGSWGAARSTVFAGSSVTSFATGSGARLGNHYGIRLYYNSWRSYPARSLRGSPGAVRTACARLRPPVRQWQARRRPRAARTLRDRRAHRRPMRPASSRTASARPGGGDGVFVVEQCEAMAVASRRMAEPPAWACGRRDQARARRRWACPQRKIARRLGRERAVGVESTWPGAAPCNERGLFRRRGSVVAGQSGYSRG